MPNLQSSEDTKQGETLNKQAEDPLRRTGLHLPETPHGDPLMEIPHGEISEALSEPRQPVKILSMRVSKSAGEISGVIKSAHLFEEKTKEEMRNRKQENPASTVEL